MASGRSAPAGAGSSELVFVTGNANKAREVEQILAKRPGDLPCRIVSRALDLPELQGAPEDIARAKAAAAAAIVSGPVITEDTSLCFEAMGGLPGPYVKHFLEALGPAGLYKMVSAFDNDAAYAQCIFAYAAGPDAEPVVFVGRTHGRVGPPSGNNRFGWDPIFRPDGFDASYAEMAPEQKNAISHRYRALDKLCDFLDQR